MAVVSSISSKTNFNGPFFSPLSSAPNSIRPTQTPHAVTNSFTSSISTSSPLASAYLGSSTDAALPRSQRKRKHKSRRPRQEHLEEDGAIAGADCSHLLRIALQQGDLYLGRSIHAVLVKNSFAVDNADTHLLNMVISLYGKAGRLSDARKVFEKMPLPDVVSYSSLIASYAKSGLEDEALRLFFLMRSSDLDPNKYSYVAALSACSMASNFGLGSQLQALVFKTNYCSDIYVGNALLTLHIKNQQFDDAVRLFNGMPDRDVASWNTIVSGMVKSLRYFDAIEGFNYMRIDGFVGDRYTLSSLLSAAEKGCFPLEGQCIHAHGIKLGLELDLSVGNALISFYTQHGHLDDVVDIFRRMPILDVVSWTGMVNGYMEFGQTELAEETFHQMTERNTVAYNSLLSGYCHNGYGLHAVRVFCKMVEDGMELSDYTFTSAVIGCALTLEMELSKQIHAFVIKVGCEFNSWIKAALLNMCVKCNRMEDGRKMLSRWSDKSSYLIAWTSMVCGYLQNGHPAEALSLFNEVIQEEGLVHMDEVAVSAILGVCGSLGFTEMGKQLHCHAVKSGNIHDIVVANAVLTMYSKCWSLDDALKCFHSMPVVNVVSWNALLTAYLLHKQGDEAFAVWRNMEMEGTCPDEITFLLIISACKYTSSDSANACRNLFLSMSNCYHIKPSQEHYASLVEVLCRWDCYSEAEELIQNIPAKPDAIVWRALLHCCTLRGNSIMGRKAMHQILALEPADASTYVLTSNIYSSFGRWQCSEKVRGEMMDVGLRKHPSQSWIVQQNKFHLFYTREKSHLRSKEIYDILDTLIFDSMKAGYVPDTSFVLHDVEEYQKKDFLLYHSAKLAIAYGFLTAAPGKPIRGLKNVRLCGDCHSFFKYMSLSTGMEIVFRDASGFHHFKHGECACGDYW